MVRHEDFVSSILVTTAWRQGNQYGGHIASEMIMHTLCNRERAGWGSILKVCQGIPKYSALTTQPNPDDYPNIWEPGAMKLLHNVQEIRSGSVQDPTRGSLYWADLAQPVGEWFSKTILADKERHPSCANMNSLMFFK